MPSYDHDSSDDDSINDVWNNDDLEGVFGDKDGGDDNGDDEIELKYPAAEHLLVLIDCAPDMFVPAIRNQHDETQELVSPMDASLQALDEYVRQRVRTTVTDKVGKRNGFGIRVFGTRKRPDGVLLHQGTQREGEDQDHDNPNPSDEEEEDSSSDEDSSTNSSPRKKKSRNNGDVSNQMLVPLEPPGPATVKKIRQCLPDPYTSDRALNLEQELGRNDEEDNDNDNDDRKESLRDVLKNVLSTFKNSDCYRKSTTKANEKFAEDSKTVWIFTNQDDPCRGDDDEKELVRTIAKDLREQSGCNIMVWPLPNKKKSEAFRRDILYEDIAEIPDHLRNKKREAYADLDVEALLAGQWKTIRRSFFLPLLFPDQVTSFSRNNRSPASNNDDDKEEEKQQKKEEQTTTYPSIMLDFFRPIQRRYIPPKVKILRDMGAGGEHVALERVTDLRIEGTGDILARFRASANQEEKQQERQQPGLTRLRHFHQLAGESIPISKKEIAELKRRCNANSEFASLVLLGFKKPQSIPFHHNLEMSYFVYPNDEIVEGSTEAFAHLHQSMLKKDVVGIGELLTRKGATSHLVAIHPIPEEVEEYGGDEGDDDDDSVVLDQKSPPGWVICVLPFENEVRALDTSNDASFTDEESVFAALPDVKENIKSLVKNMHMPSCEIGVDFKNQYIEKFWDYVEGIALGDARPADEDYRINPIDDQDVLDALRNKATAVLTSLPEDATKEKRKLDKLVADENTNWQQEIHRLSEYRAADLKIGLRRYGCKISGTKPVLVERLREAIQDSMNGGNN